MNIFEYVALDENEKPLDNMVTDGGMCAIFRKIACVGDSLSSGEFESDDGKGNKSYHDMYEFSWGQNIARDIGAEVYNFSKAGMSSREFCESFAEENGFWDKEKACQAYIIAMGLNDLFADKTPVGEIADIDLENYNNNKPTIAGNYAKMIQRYKEIEPHAKFFLVTPPYTEDGNLPQKKALRDLLEEMTKIFKNTYLIDLYTYAPHYDGEFNTRFFMGGHMTPAGYVLTAKIIESYIDYIVRHNPDDFRQIGFIGKDYYNTVYGR